MQSGVERCRGVWSDAEGKGSQGYGEVQRGV